MLAYLRAMMRRLWTLLTRSWHSARPMVGVEDWQRLTAGVTEWISFEAPQPDDRRSGMLAGPSELIGKRTVRRTRSMDVQVTSRTEGSIVQPPAAVETRECADNPPPVQTIRAVPAQPRPDLIDTPSGRDALTAPRAAEEPDRNVPEVASVAPRPHRAPPGQEVPAVGCSVAVPPQQPSANAVFTSRSAIPMQSTHTGPWAPLRAVEVKPVPGLPAGAPKRSPWSG